MIEWLFTFLVFYLLYKLIFDFILPVSRASAQIKSKVNQTRSQQQTYAQQKRTFSSEKNTAAKPKPAKEDYIDFEEVN